jgi:recombinational DNA repair ATPase RecF
MSRLRLREVRLSGFKTFADKTTIAFTPGITAIVGPNGSGKSNIVDALRWGFGEAGRGIRSKRVDESSSQGQKSAAHSGLPKSHSQSQMMMGSSTFPLPKLRSPVVPIAAADKSIC